MQRARFLRILLVLFLVCAGVSLTQLCMAEGIFSLKIGMYRFGSYSQPLDRVFRIKGEYPTSFQVIITNMSSSAESFYENAASSGYSSISFEITDEKGNTNVVRKKRDPYASSTVTSQYLRPGEKRVFDILIEEDTWENAYKLQKQGARKFKVRAVYDNNSTTSIYSEYYDLEISDAYSSSSKKESSQSSSSNGSGVLVSK